MTGDDCDVDDGCHLLSLARLDGAASPECGVPIVGDGHRIGAVGASGVESSEDVRIAPAGIAALGA